MPIWGGILQFQLERTICTHRRLRVAANTPLGDHEQQGNQAALSRKVLDERVPVSQRWEEAQHGVCDAAMPRRRQLEDCVETPALGGRATNRDG